jgi:hypothetical protein
LVAASPVRDLLDRAKDLSVDAIAAIGRTKMQLLLLHISARLRVVVLREVIHMGTFLGLFALSLILGFALGRSTWLAIAISSATLAALGAAVLRRHGFEIFPGIATTAACLAIHQVAYLARLWFHTRGGVPRQRPVQQAA